MTSTTTTRLCFLLGVDLRCGTNYLWRLLREHPDCVGAGPIWEDHFIQHSYLLRKYAEHIYGSWDPHWEVEAILGDKEVLLQCLGEAIEKFIKSQIILHNTSQDGPAQVSTNQGAPKIFLSKTPSVENIDNFFDLFPNAYLILLDRDGRAVVESGVRSFYWDYEDSMIRWRNRAQTIIDFMEKYHHLNEKLILVRYEDLVANEKETLIKIFNYLDLNPEVYNYIAASSGGVIGSSELRTHSNTMHWSPVEKTADFNPLTRFRHWDRHRHERFNWIAGEQMERLGYQLIEFKYHPRFYLIRNKLFDTQTFVLKVLRDALTRWSNNVFHKIVASLSQRGVR